MKARTSDFKNLISGVKETKTKITYGSVELSDEQLNSIQPHYQGSLLKSIMKELDLDSNVEIPKDTIINLQFGVKVREASGNDDGYDYINYGNYVVYSSEKQEDTNSYLIKCYDKMLYSMVDYETIKYRNLFDNIFRQGTQSSTTTGNRIVNNNNFKLKANTTYTISTNLSSDYKFAVTLNDNPLPNSATNFYDSGWVTNQVKTFTPSRDGYIGILVCKSNGTDALTPSSIANYIFQLELGSTATEYEPFGNIQYPISIRKYIDILCFNIGLVFKNKNDYFTNYDKTIDNELYLDENGNSLGYKFRDVLDELAQVTGSIICINEEDDELEIRYPSNAGAIRTSVSGKDLTLANVDDIKVDDIELTGETTQETTTGKNIFKSDYGSTTRSGVTFTKNADGSFTLNGTATQTDWYRLADNFTLVAGTYTISNSNDNASFSTAIFYDDSHNFDISGVVPSLSTKTFTSSVTIKPYIRINNGATFNNFKIYPMIEVGSNYTGFEPYTGTQPSPNPDYPQEVVNVTGRQEVKCVGKNLYYIEPQTLNGVTLSYASDGAIVLNGTSNASFTAFRSTVSLNGNYTLSAKASAVQSSTYIRTRNASSTIGHNIQLSSTSQLTATANVQISTLEITIGASGITYNNFKIYVQLESGSSATTYEPYKEQVNEINLGKNLFIPTTQVSGTNIVVANGTVTLNNDEFTLNATGNDCYFGQVSASGNAYTNNRGILIDVSGMSKITFSLTNTQFNNIYITAYNNSKTSLGYTNFTSYKGTYTIPTSAKYISIRFGLSNAVSGTSYSTKVQIEKGTEATSYSEYFTPIELCKIGTYQDKIFKNSGKNLFNYQWFEAFMPDLKFIQVTGLKPHTDYTLSSNIPKKSENENIANLFLSATQSPSTGANGVMPNQPRTINTGSLNYLYVGYRDNAGNLDNEATKYWYMLEESSTATEYEPYGSGEWYVKKATGKIDLSTCTWTKQMDLTANYKLFYTSSINNIKYASSNTQLIDNYSEKYIKSIASGMSGTNKRNMLAIDTSAVRVQAIDVPTGLFYYPLASPTYEKLNDTLQNQLSNILLLEGLNNVTTSVPINLNYVSDMDTIDEEFFDENNVNFGEVYGPVNTVILSRSAESDEIAKSLVENEEDRIAIKISDNQILNFDGREEYLDGLLNRLSGTMYVQNDYTSKGICYYNIGDRYKAYIFGKYYRCLMLNDDVTIESGLSENVFTEIPETAETDYSKTSTSDKTVRKANLIVNKQLGEITAEISTIDDQLNSANGITSKLTSQGQTIDLWSKSFDDNGNVVALNTTNYTFDNEGLKIGKSTDDYNSLQDNTGTYYYEKDTMIGKYTKDGSVQKDLALFGKYYYGIDEDDPNFNVRTFTVANAKFVAQWYDDGTEEGFGHFWNGE